MYSLGAMLYEMVTGTAPFEGGSVYAIMNSRLTGDPVRRARSIRKFLPRWKKSSCTPWSETPWTAIPRPQP